MLSGARLQARPLQLELGGSRLIRLPRLPRSHQTAAHDHQNRRKWPIEQPTQCARLLLAALKPDMQREKRDSCSEIACVRCCAADSEDPGQDRPYELRGRKDQIAWQEEEEIIQAEAARTTERQEHHRWDHEVSDRHAFAHVAQPPKGSALSWVAQAADGC